MDTKQSLIGIDFETDYTKGDYDIGRYGPHQYIRHELFNPYLVSIYGVHSVQGPIKYVGPLKDFKWSLLDDQNLTCHNLGFDSLVWSEAISKGIIPPFFAARAFCSADLAVWCNAPRSLAGACRTLTKLELKKSTRDKMSGMKFEEALAKGMKQELFEYALKDSIGTYELCRQHLHTWPSDEIRIADSVRAQGDYGIQIDTEYMKECLDRLEFSIWKASRDIPWDWTKKKTPLAHSLVRIECHKAGIPMPSSLAKDAPECIQWENDYADKYPWIRALRAWRRSSMLLGKFQAMERRVDTEGIMRFRLKYMGAAITRRFSGDSGYNLQNLPRDPYEGVDLRRCIIPRPGKIFGIIDYSQIEARLLLHHVKDRRTLKLIREGADLYEAHARTTLGYKDPKPLREVDPKLRGLAKARCLGLGYGCGKVKFQTVAKSMAGLDLALEESEKIVKAYRESNPLITAYWKLNHDCLKESIRQKDKTYENELLNGQLLTYYQPKRNEEDETVAQVVRGAHFVRLYGAKLVENEQQALGRELLCDAMLRLETAGVRVLFTVHDEFVLELDESSAQTDLQEAIRIILDAPDWINGCPIAVEGGLFTSFSKKGEIK